MVVVAAFFLSLTLSSYFSSEIKLKTIVRAAHLLKIFRLNAFFSEWVIFLYMWFVFYVIEYEFGVPSSRFNDLTDYIVSYSAFFVIARRKCSTLFYSSVETCSILWDLIEKNVFISSQSHISTNLLVKYILWKKTHEILFAARKLSALMM